MSGFGTSKSTTQQSSVQRPLEEAMPSINGILGQLNGNLQKTGVTASEDAALYGGQTNALDWTKQFAPQISIMCPVRENSYSRMITEGGEGGFRFPVPTPTQSIPGSPPSP